MVIFEGMAHPIHLVLPGGIAGFWQTLFALCQAVIKGSRPIFILFFFGSSEGNLVDTQVKEIIRAMARNLEDTDKCCRLN